MELEHNLEETVIGILKGADLEIATELSVRTEAEKLLSVDLSDIATKRLVRRIIESFLLSSSPPIDEETEPIEELQTEKSPVDDRKLDDDGGGRVICKLPGMRRVSIQKFRGTKLVSIREYYQKEGKVFPSGRGITLNPKQWSAFRSSFSDIEAAISKMEANIRGKVMEKRQTEPEASSPSTSLASEPCDLEKPQTELEGSYPSTSLASEPRVREELQIHPLIPIATTRFTGRNYYCWKRQMEFFLNQLKIFYVLLEPCPKIPVSEQNSESKSRTQKWINDDYICRQTILNSLSDQLFDQYSVKPLNAGQLWNKLESLYADDFGTKRSHVNTYIQFQMVDGVSVLEQVQELHRIAGLITASGISIDENFHVSAIISKLPPSWKHIRAKLMQEEHLPHDKLIYRLKDEEDYRNSGKNNGGGQKKNDTRVWCFGCGKEGHIRRNCPLTRSYQWSRSQGSEQPREGWCP
ncbi:hypothetical protein OSB04_un001820 [Centaurea solstitialis]|uniref:CCHC-type domain-containing protein n=1 Tax=Centaurea solstitialis TaxID=347529 RepID=A0AA38VQJ3_9ASTR|nr:hypothetical protein OSB04_un001820 [Centaurea solstitialis]